MHVVVTGGAGFIGANLCEHLASRGHRVVAFDDLSSGTVENLSGIDVELVEGSILDREALGPLLADADSVVHLAARPSVPRSVADPGAAHAVNATGTLHVLQAAQAAGHPQIVLASSSSVYGANPVMPKHEDLACRPRSPYAASKLAAEAYVAAWSGSYGARTLVFRFFNVYGPRQRADHAYAAAIPAFVDAALADRPIPVEGDGEQTRDFTYVGSVCNVLAEAVERGVTSEEPINLAFGARHSLNEVIGELASVVGRPLVLDQRPPRVGDVRHSEASTERLRSLFPDAIPVSFPEGLGRTVAWYEQHRAAV